MISVSDTAVRTAAARPSRAAHDMTACAADDVRTHTRTLRTVDLLLPREEKTTDAIDHYALSGGKN